MKLSVIGGGGVRSLFLAKSIAQQSTKLGIKELYLMDIDSNKLNIFGGMAKKTAACIDPNLKVILTTDPLEAVTNADYVITTIRVGGDRMRIKDERIALAKGILGQETTGAAGFSFAMRSIPVLAKYCQLIKEHAKPSVKVFNFTNPVGVVSQGLRDLGYDFTFGICDAPSGLLNQISTLMSTTPEYIQGECYGLNHLSYFPHIYLNGKDIVPELIETDDLYNKTDERFFEKELLQHEKCLLNEYLYYYYYREKAVYNILTTPQTRGEIISDFNYEMHRELLKIDVENDFEQALATFSKWYGRREDLYMRNETNIKRDKSWSFDIHSPDAGGYAGVALKYIDIITSTNGFGSMILCAPNKGAIPQLADDDVVEITCDISKEGCTPHSFPNIDPRHLALIKQVKMYERFAAKAINEKSIAYAIDSLTAHPLINSYSLAKSLINEYLLLNEEYCQDWK